MIMPTELRRIVFTYSEATDAITAYGSNFGMTFPQGKIVKAAFANQKDYRAGNAEEVRPVIVTFFDDKSLEHKYFNLNSDLISQALIEYCFKHNVMLPKAGVKTLELNEFNFILDVSYLNSKDGSPGPLSLED